MGDELITRGLVQIQLEGKGIDDAVAQMQKIVANAKTGAASVDAIGTSAKAAAKEVGYLGEQFAALGTRVVAGLGVIELGRFVKDSFLEFAKLDRAFTTLSNEIDAVGGAAAGSFPRVKEALKALGDETGQLDAELIPAMNRLLLTTDNVTASTELLTIAAIYARAGFGDLETNATKLALALQTGTVRSLRGFGIQLKDTEGHAIDLGEAFKRIFEKAEILKVQAPDAQAKVEKWKQTFEDIALDAGHAADAVLNLFDRLGKLQSQRFAADAEDAKIRDDSTWYGKRLKQLAENMAAEADAFSEVPGNNASELHALEMAAQEAARLKHDADKKAAEEKAKLDAENTRKMLETDKGLYEDGSQDRYRIEVALGQAIHDEAIRQAKLIGASTTAIDKQFADQKLIEARKLAQASGSEPSPETGAAIIKEHQEIERLEEAHQDRMRAIEDAGVETALKSVRDRTIQGTVARILADEALQRASLQKKIDAEVTANDKIYDSALKTIRASTVAGEHRDRLEAKAAQDHADEIVAIKANQAAEEQAISHQTELWEKDASDRQTARIQDSANRTGNALVSIFGKHKGFAIGMAIMQTSQAIMNIWAADDGAPWYVHLAETIAMAAEGAAQIQSIRGATVTGGGNIASASGGRSASSPQFAQSGSTTAPPAFTSGSNSSLSMAPVSAAAMANASGRSNGGPPIVVNIGHAFGDQRSMTKLAREITRTFDNDPSRWR